MAEAMAEAKAEGVEAVVFGDLFLADIRTYRERQLARAGCGRSSPFGAGTPPLLLIAVVPGG